MSNKIKFVLDGCDISLDAEAPRDMTIEQLIKQADRIKLDYCACGVRSFEGDDDTFRADVSFDYNDVKKVYEFAPCTIKAVSE